MVSRDRNDSDFRATGQKVTKNLFYFYNAVEILGNFDYLVDVNYYFWDLERNVISLVAALTEIRIPTRKLKLP